MTTFRRLTREELAELTGRRRRKCITGWLTAHGWIFERDANGWPIVSAAYAEGRLSGNSPAPGATRPGQPNFDAIRSAA